MIEILTFNKTARTISFKTEKGATVSVSGLDPEMDDAKLKDYISTLSAQEDKKTLDPEAPLSKVTLKATDKFDSTIAIADVVAEEVII